MDLNPTIRDVQPIPIQHEGQPAFLLRDPLELNSHMLVIPKAIAPLLYLCDGTRDLDTIRLILDYHFQLKVRTEEIQAILQTFDRAFLIENERSQAALQDAAETFRAGSFREPASAGGSYPADPAELHELLEGFLQSVDTEPDPLAAGGLLSPHIDFARGGRTYARVWKRAALSLREADLIVIIGTDHFGGSNEITLTRQHYATPYGVLPTDRGIVQALAGAVGEEQAFKGEVFHKTEHSLELPLVWLHHLLDRREVPVVPVLCGALPPGSRIPARFSEALQKAAAGRRVFTVVSGDLAHVGPAFGGEPLAGDAFETVEKSDRELLELLSRGDGDAFLAEIMSTDNENNVCGMYPLYLALQASVFRHGELNGYQQCPADEDGASIVSIGGVVFR